MHLESVSIRHLELVVPLALVLHAMSRAGRGANAYRVWGIRGLDTLALEQEPNRVHSLALSLAEGRHKLVELGGALDLEKDLVVVVGNLDVQVLDGGRSILTASRRASILVFARHFVTIADKGNVSNRTRLMLVVWTLQGSTGVDGGRMMDGVLTVWYPPTLRCRAVLR